MKFKDKYQKRAVVSNFILIIIAISVIGLSWFAGTAVTHAILSPILNIITEDLYSRSDERIYRIDEEVLPVRVYNLEKFAIDKQYIDLISLIVSSGFVFASLIVAFIMQFIKKNDLNNIMNNMTESERIAFITQEKNK